MAEPSLTSVKAVSVFITRTRTSPAPYKTALNTLFQDTKQKQWPDGHVFTDFAVFLDKSIGHFMFLSDMVDSTKLKTIIKNLRTVVGDLRSDADMYEAFKQAGVDLASPKYNPPFKAEEEMLKNAEHDATEAQVLKPKQPKPSKKTKAATPHDQQSKTLEPSKKTPTDYSSDASSDASSEEDLDFVDGNSDDHDGEEMLDMRTRKHNLTTVPENPDTDRWRVQKDTNRSVQEQLNELKVVVNLQAQLIEALLVDGPDATLKKWFKRTWRVEAQSQGGL